MKEKLSKKPTVASTTPLHELAYEEIRRSLMSGRFAPGSKMTSRGLALALGTSDMPVRAALGRLVAEGGLIQRVNGTIAIPVLSRVDFEEVMSLRSLLEGRATYLASTSLTKLELNLLKKIAAELTKAMKEKDIVKYLDANHRFKFAIYEQCHSPILISLIGNLWLRAGPFLRNLEKSSNLNGAMSIHHHTAALKALVARDAKGAAKAISADIEEGMSHVLKMAEFPEDAELAPVKRLKVLKDSK
jgi:DNA-binding GntR family transcriptional regulator